MTTNSFFPSSAPRKLCISSERGSFLSTGKISVSFPLIFTSCVKIQRITASGQTFLLHGDAVISLDFITQEVKISGKETEILPVDKKEPLSLEIQSFLGALEGKNELVVTPKQAVNVTKIAQASLLSSQKGTPIYLD